MMMVAREAWEDELERIQIQSYVEFLICTVQFNITVNICSCNLSQ
jgi:hypothetical protein